MNSTWILVLLLWLFIASSLLPLIIICVFLDIIVILWIRYFMRLGFYDVTHHVGWSSKRFGSWCFIPVIFTRLCITDHASLREASTFKSTTAFQSFSKAPLKVEINDVLVEKLRGKYSNAEKKYLNQDEKLLQCETERKATKKGDEKIQNH